MSVYRLSYLLLLLLLSNEIAAQILGEPTAVRHFYGRYWQRHQLWGEQGLGRYALLQHLPEAWYNSFEKGPREERLYGPFGIVRPQLRALADNSLALRLEGADTGEWNAHLFARLSLQQVNTSLRASGYGLSQKNDRNLDGYLDLPIQRRLLLDNEWAIYLRRFTSLNTVRLLTWNQQGGQTHYDPNQDYGSTRAYGQGQFGNHLSYTSQNYISTEDDNGWRVHWRLSDHSQSRYFGLRQYEGKEWQMRARAAYHYRLPDEFNLFVAGLFYQYQSVREEVDSLRLERREGFGGGFLGYESRLNERVQLTTRVHLGYHNLARWQVLPYAKLSLYLPKNWQVNLLAGSSLRYANPLDENAFALASNRTIQLPEQFEAERIWYYGGTVEYNTWVDKKRQWLLAFDGHCYFSWFTNKVVADVDSDPYALDFYNSNQTAQEITLMLDQRWTYLRTGLMLRLRYRLDSWFTTIGGRWRQEPFYAPHNWLLALETPLVVDGFRWAHIRVQATTNAGRRLPDVSTKTQAAGSPDYPNIAPLVFRLDWRVTLDGSTLLFQRWKLTSLTLFVGMDNLLNAKQPIAPVGSNQPFEPFFDAGLGWNTSAGRRLYLGAQYRFL